MPKPLKVGLTGGIGTGKSSALEAFRRFGAAVVSLDEMAHRFSRPGGPVYRSVLLAFGRKYLDVRGRLDRGALAKDVFSRPALRRRLERATHPILLKEMRREISKAKRPVVVADVPLLFEVGRQNDFDVTMVVSSSAGASIRRVMRRDGASRSQVLRRMKAQMPLARKERLADVVLKNDKNPKALSDSVREYYRAFELIARAGRLKPILN